MPIIVGPAAGYPRVSKIAVLALALAGSISAGQGVLWALPQQEVSEISRIATAQGRSPEDIRRLIEQAELVEAKGLPPEPILDKIKEGLAKGVDSRRLDPVLSKMSANMQTADNLIKETSKMPVTPSNRTRALEVLSEALGRGVTPDEVRAISKAAGESQHPERLAYGAKGLALIKEGGVSVGAGQSLMASGLRGGLDSSTLLDLAREVKRRREELRDNPTRLRDIQNSVERGDRLEKIFGDGRTGRDAGQSERLERGNSGQNAIERPDRQTRPDRPERPERPERRHRP